MSRKSVSIGLAVLLVSLLLAGVLSGLGCGEETGDIEIGAVLSLSGPAAPLGEPEERSLELYEEQINKDGGINGRQVKFIIEDDESEPTKAATAITKLINQEGVCAVIGSSTSGATLAMSPIAEKQEVPLVCCAANTSITQPVKKYVFRTPPTDSMAIEKVLGYLSDTLKVTRIAILHDANAFGTGGADELTEKAPEYDIEVVISESYGSNDTNMVGQLTKIQQTDAEALVVWGTNPGPASIAKNMQELGMTLPYVASHGIANKKFVELAGDAANGVVFPAGRCILPSSIPEGSEWRKAVDDFSAAYKEMFDKDIDTFAAHGYDAALIIGNAIDEGGTTDPIKLRDQIEKTKDLVGIDGVYTYSPDDHDGLSVDDLVMIKIENGEWVQAVPSDQ